MSSVRMPPGWTAVARTPRRGGGGRTRPRTGCWRSSSGHRRPTDHRACRSKFGIVEVDVGEAVAGRGEVHQPAAVRPISGAMRLTRTKWPRWLVPNCVSKPSAVWPNGRGHHAGIGDDDVEQPRRRRAARRRRRARWPARRDRIRPARCRRLPASAPRTAVAASALARSRAAPTTWAPWAASARAVSTPSPAETPVTSTRLPREIDAREHLVGGRGRAK